MTKRIDTIKRLRRSVPRRRAAINRELAKHNITVEKAESLVNRYWDVVSDEEDLQRYEAWYRDLGDSWAKDDWPHACCAGVRGRGTPLSLTNHNCSR